MVSAKSILIASALFPLMLQAGPCDDGSGGGGDTDGVAVGDVATLVEQCNHCHDAGGMATVVDENTIRFDDFTYDGADVDVYIYLGIEGVSLRDYGIQLSEELKVEHNGSTFELDLPEGITLEDFDTVSVYCYRYDEVFATGLFSML